MLKARKPTPYPKEARIGEHLRRRRRELRLRQIDVAEKLNVNVITLSKWENNKTTPAVRFYPQIIEFLGFDPHGTPQCMGEEIAARRRVLGLSRKALAQMLSLGEGTLACFEEGASKPTGKCAEIVSAFLTT